MMAKPGALLFAGSPQASAPPVRLTGNQEAIGTREMTDASSSTIVTATPEKRGGLHALSLAAGSESHLDWRSDGADFIDSA